MADRAVAPRRGASGCATRNFLVPCACGAEALRAADRGAETLRAADRAGAEAAAGGASGEPASNVAALFLKARKPFTCSSHFHLCHFHELLTCPILAQTDRDGGSSRLRQ